MYDVAIVGGGLGGLIAALELGEHRSVLLLEKESYPFHRVCGEYISNESRTILAKHGADFAAWHLPEIKRLKLSATAGKTIEAPLDLGGFGISRFKLDAFLAEQAKNKGIDLRTGTRVENWTFEKDHFTLQSTAGEFRAKVLISAHGKRSKLDSVKRRPFFKKRTPYVGIKYHVHNPNIAADQIVLHNFKGGYLGCSRVEDNTVCICYLIMQNQLNRYASIAEFEAEVLHQNKHIKDLLTQSEHLYEKPLVISQISFAKKEQVLEHALMVGDAAGLISPLSGNGMSMAMHAGVLAAQYAEAYLAGKMSRETMEQMYTRAWRREFFWRLKIGKWIQSSFGLSWSSTLFVRLIAPFPRLQQRLIRLTHGKSFGLNDSK